MTRAALAILALAVSAPAAAAGQCVFGCDGYLAGYSWAEDNAVEDVYACDDVSDSITFIGGCEDYVREQERRQSGPQPARLPQRPAPVAIYSCGEGSETRYTATRGPGCTQVIPPRQASPPQIPPSRGGPLYRCEQSDGGLTFTIEAGPGCRPVTDVGRPTLAATPAQPPSSSVESLTEAIGRYSASSYEQRRALAVELVRRSSPVVYRCEYEDGTVTFTNEAKPNCLVVWVR